MFRNYGERGNRFKDAVNAPGRTNQTAYHENEENPENASPADTAASAPAESLRAKAAANAETNDNEDCEAEHKTNMKFSHALVVVLALHIIAVGGVFAFNSIKAGQTASTKGANPPPAGQGSAQSKPSPAQGAIEGWVGKTHIVQAGDTLSRIAALYKTSLELIEKENGITTYSMIRVGQVLKVPASAARQWPTGDGSYHGSRQACLPRGKDGHRRPPVVDTKTTIAKPPVAARQTS
jgi:LysM repeat protein